MKSAALALAALAAVGLMVSVSSAAGGALSYPMAAHVAAKYGIHHSGHNPGVRQVHYRHHPSYRHRYHPGPVVVHPPVYRRPVVVVPRYVAPRVYPYPAYYPSYPPRGINYHGPGFSIGFGF